MVLGNEKTIRYRSNVAVLLSDELGGSNAELSVIARAEYLYGDPLGNSSLYTLLEGNISDNLSYTVCAHWLSSEPGALYTNTLHSDDVNWLDYAYLTYSLDKVELSLGKADLCWGTYEMDEYDWDVHIPFATTMWSALPIYQWGIRASWLPIENLTLDFKVSSSPFSEHPFGDGLLTYGLRARYEQEDSFGAMVAYNLFNTGVGDPLGVLSAGAQVYVGESRIVADYTNKVGDFNFIFLNGFTTSLMGTVPVGEQFEVLAKAGYEKIASGGLEYMTAAAGLHWLPYEWLRVHAIGGYRWGDSNIGYLDPGLFFNLGVTCNIPISL